MLSSTAYYPHAGPQASTLPINPALDVVAMRHLHVRRSLLSIAWALWLLHVPATSSCCRADHCQRMQEAFWQRMRSTAASPAAADAALASHLIKLITAPGLDSRACLSQAVEQIGCKVRQCLLLLITGA